MRKLFGFVICFVFTFSMIFDICAMESNGYVIDYASGNLDTGKIKTYDELFNVKISLGDENASIRIIKYLSIQCKYCKDIFLETYGYFLEESEKGNLYLELKFVDYPKFKFDDYIFERYPEIDTFNSIYNIYNTYDTWINFTTNDEFDKFFELGDVMLERVIHERIAMAEFKAIGLKGVPSTIINGELIDLEIDTLDEFKEIIKKYANIALGTQSFNS